MTTEILQRTNTEPWYAGMRNLFSREIYHERSRMYWIQQLLVWTLFTNGLVATMFSLPTGLVEEMASSYILGLVTFFSMLGLLISIFIPVLLQGTIIDEKVSGTSAWILSKPVSKKSYLLSKLITSILAIIGISVVINGLVAYGVFVAFGFSPNITGFIIDLGLTGIVVVYFASLTVMLGTLTTSRGKVLATAVGVGLGAQIMARYFPLILFLIPYSLPIMGLGFITGDPVIGLEWILLSACVQIIIFTVVALSVFDRTEL
ncbi:MAG: ABC transporter permease [Candidatus Thorarchaeota archaeon]